MNNHHEEMKMRVTPTGWRVEIPAGRYFLGDPCYAVPDELWLDLLNDAEFFESSPVGTVDGVEVLAFHTAYGDGIYRDQTGMDYSVDAGMIGLTPMEPDGWPRYSDEELDQLGRVVVFSEPVLAQTDGEGRMTFGHLEIDTTDEEDEGW